MTTQIFRDTSTDLNHRAKWWTSRIAIYGVLILWAIICLFPIYWTITTSFKMAPNVMKGNLIPWWDYQPAWLGWKSLGLSPDTIGAESTVRAEFLKRFFNSLIISLTSSTLAVVMGSLAAYGLSRFSYKWAWMRNSDISFFFLSQLILPPVVLALPFLVLYKELALLDTRVGLILLYTLSVLPIVIWIMRDQFGSIPTELEEAALVRILTEPKNALTKQYQKLFQMEGVELEFRPEALKAIARRALERKTGARGLRSIVEATLIDTMYDLPGSTDIAKVVVEEAAITGDSKPLYVLQEGVQAQAG